LGRCFSNLGDPALANLLQRYRIEEMQLFAAALHGGNQVRCFEQNQVLRHSLPRHIQVFTQLVECAPHMNASIAISVR
jgi:hypothetical protein